MLKELTVKNFALISELKVEPSNDLSVITGETGAGKSILLGALGLILGERADTTAILNKEEKCTVEAMFEISEDVLNSFFEENELDFDKQTIIRREITPNGKSRSFVNDTPVNLQTLKTLGGYLVDIHTQNTSTNLQSSVYQMSVLDAFAENNNLLKQYTSLFLQYKNTQHALKELEEKESKINNQLEFNRFQFEELDKASIEAEEEKLLETKIDILENAGEIGQNCLQAYDALAESQINALDIINSSKALLKSTALKHEVIANLMEQLSRIALELKEVANDLKRIGEQTEANPQELEKTNQRFMFLQNLMRKHRVSDTLELIEIRTKLSEELYCADHLEVEKNKLNNQLLQILSELETIGKQLSANRIKAAVKMSEEIEILLNELEMRQANFSISINSQNNIPLSNGYDSIEFLFSANGGALQNMSKVASGGEMSRLMFALKCVIAGKTNMPTLIFDEIDSGISGEAATRMGQLMEKLATKHQVIAVTHLAQIASKGSKHFYVFKKSGSSQIESSIKTLGKEERVTEIAKMISGNNPMESALEHARKLISKS